MYHAITHKKEQIVHLTIANLGMNSTNVKHNFKYALNFHDEKLGLGNVQKTLSPTFRDNYYASYAKYVCATSEISLLEPLIVFCHSSRKTAYPWQCQ